MTRYVMPVLPMSPESEYDRRLQQYLQAALGVTLPRVVDELSRAVGDAARVSAALTVALGAGGAPTSVTSSVPVFVPFGTAAAPGLAFAGTQTGIYGSATQWSVSIGGVDAATIDAIGSLRVGVQTGAGDANRRWVTVHGLFQGGVQLQSGSPAADRGLIYGNNSGLFAVAVGRMFLSGGNDTSRGVAVTEAGTLALRTLASDPSGTSHGEVWALSSGVFRRNRNGTLENW